MSMSKETKLKEKSTRVKRKRLEKAGPLYIDPEHFEPGKVYRVVNMTPGEVARRQRMGYEIVEDKNIVVGDQNATKSGKLGNAVILDVGKSSEQKAVLMSISVEDHQEIVDELNQLTLETEAALFDKPSEGLSQKEKSTLYGGIQINNG